MIFSYLHIFDCSLTLLVILMSWQIFMVFDAILDNYTLICFLNQNEFSDTRR